MKYFSPEQIDHLIATLIMIGLFLLVLFLFLLIAVWIGGRLEQSAREQKVDLLFLELWDGSKTNKLETWKQVRRELATRNAGPQTLAEVDRRIRQCAAEQKIFRSVALRGGRTVIISTQN